MAWSQVKKPNVSQDLVVRQGGKALNSWLGWCLAVVQTAYGSGWAGSTAWQGWTSIAKKKHTGTPPKGVYVPVWFSGYGGLGHVAIYKDGKVYSSPYTNKPYWDVLNSLSDVEKKYGVKYVGWSEDIGGTQVIKEVVVAKVTEAQIKQAYQDVLGTPFGTKRPADAGGLKHYLEMAAQGKSLDWIKADLKASAEYKKRKASFDAQVKAKAAAEAAKKAAEAAEKARLEAEAKKKAEEEAQKNQVDKWGEENNSLLKQLSAAANQILALLKSVFNR